MSAAQRERHRMEYGYLPPRLSQAEAIREAALNTWKRGWDSTLAQISYGPACLADGAGSGCSQLGC